MRVLLVGTGTDVGKTHVTCAIAAAARAAGRTVAAYKPVATGCDPTCDDCVEHARATGRPYAAPTFSYRRPISPHLAAREEGRAITLEPIVAEAERLAREVDLVLVETAGGLFSPLSDALVVADLARALSPDVILLIFPDRIGVLHDVRATVLAAESVGLPRALLASSAPGAIDASTGSNPNELAHLGLGPVVARFPRSPWDSEASLRAGADAVSAFSRPRPSAPVRRDASLARLRALLEALPAVVYEYEREADGTESIPFFIGSLSEKLGYDRALGTAPADVFARVHPDDLPRLHEQTLRSIESLDLFDLEVRYRVQPDDETFRRLRIRSRPERDERGVIRWTGVILDVTEAWELTEAMHRAQRREAIGELAAGVAHNFNNMLAAILGNLEELRIEVSSASAGTGPAPQVLDDALQATHRAAELVSRLLHVGRGGDSQMGSIDLVEVVRDVLKLCRTTFDASIDFDVVLAVEDAPVLGDRAHLQQVLLNLLLNARDALAGRDSPRIALHLHEVRARLGSADRHFVLSVEDNGAGMSEQTLARLGEPFFTTKGPTGTGLGLATAWRTLRDVGASVAVRSKLGRGTEITLRFPYSPCSRKERASLTPSPVVDLRVLVVDDEPIVRRSLQRILAGARAKVEVASTGDEALAMLSFDSAFDAVLLDLAMPGIPGERVLHAIRERWPRIAVVVLSGDTHRAGLAEADVILQKPAARTTVLDAIGRAVTARRAR